MKNLFFVLLLVFFTAISLAQSNPTKIYVNSFYECREDQKEDAEIKLSAFELHIAMKLEEVYKCVKTSTSFEVKSMLKHFRDDQLLGFDQSDNQKRWDNIASATSGKFLVAINLKVINQTALVTLMFMDKTKAQSYFRSSLSCSFSALDQTVYEKLTKEMLEELKEYEICPFKGFVKIKIVSDLKDEQKEEYPVYCNSIDGYYKKTTSIKNYSEIDWNIEKLRLNASRGNVKVNLNEETVIDEINPCFECTPQKQGARTYFEKTNTYATVQGLSKESESEGVKVDDARAELTFLENGTYTIRIKAASNKSQKKTVKEIRAQGVCQNINERPQPIVNAIDLPLNELFGPFKGNAQDKVLSQRGSFEREDPNTKLKETITFEFNLVRD